MNIIYYVTSHGYGHGVRTAAICNAFSPGVRITFRTTLPKEFFREEVKRDFAYAPALFDCGSIQKESLSADAEATLAAYRRIAEKNRTLLESEVRWCREQNAGVIASDITPFAFEVAQRCGIPSVAVTNFTWHDIYEEYVRRRPEYAPELQKVRSQYASAALLLALEPALPMAYFKKRLDVPPVGRSGRARRAEIAARFGFGPDRRIALVYFGHLGITGIDWRELARFKEWEFLGIGDIENAPPNYHPISKSEFPYQDLVASADLMVCKLGYGAVAEAMLHGTPLLYPPRRDFAEHPCLDAAVRAWGGGRFLGERQFRRMEWDKALDAVTAQARPAAKPVNGAKQCAEAIENLSMGY